MTNGLTGAPLTVYKWANRDATEGNFTIQNPAGFQYVSDTGAVIATADPRRKYKALITSLNRPLKNRWSMQLSYVWAKAEGNVNNSGYGNWLGGVQWDSPDTALVHAYGELTNSRRHEIKGYFSYQIPKAEVMASVAYTATSGLTYAAYQRFSNSSLNLPAPSSRRDIFIEDRGSRRNDFYNNIDLRVEKVFKYAGNRFGVYMDAMNLFNTATILTRQARYPSSGDINFLAPLTVQSARQVYFGGRWSF